MNEILGRTDIETDIKRFLSDFDNIHTDKSYKRGTYIYGLAGVGKTQFVTSLLTDMNYDIIHYDAGDVRNKSSIDTLTVNNISNKNVLQLMYKVSKKIAIVMDEMDGLNLGDKGCISALIKLIRQKKTKKQKTENVCAIPIICIGSYYTDKKIKELLNVCNVYELKPPTKSQNSELINWVFPEIRRLPSELQDNISEYTKTDLRKIFFLKKLCDSKPEILTNVDLLKCILENKNVNDNAKQLTRELIRNKYPLNIHDKLINDADRTTTSLLFHENIIDVLSNFNKKDAIKFYSKFLNNMCFSDYIDKTTFQNQTWIFNEISSIMKIFKNNYLFHTDLIDNISNKLPDEIYDLNEIRFTKILTKYSSEYNNQIFLLNICQKMEMDKKDVLLFFYNIKNKTANSSLTATVDNNSVECLTELDINRMFRFLDKNIKNITICNDIDDCVDDEARFIMNDVYETD